MDHTTKPELALEMPDSFISEEIPFQCIQADELYGNDSKFISDMIAAFRLCVTFRAILLCT